MAETSPCPRCGAVGSGNFCSECGASRGSTTCPACGHVPEAGARFCTRCGGPLAASTAGAAAPAAGAPTPASPAGGAGRESNLGWWVAGLALVALILFVAYPVLSRSDDSGAARQGAGAAGAGAGGAGAVDLGSMTPEEAADRLYVRVKNAEERGDVSEMGMFLPMAIGAHERALPLDDDRLFHLAQLQLWAEDAQGARGTAEALLARSPDHLLALGTAAAAAESLGEGDQANGHWRRFLDVYDQEMASDREDYQGHPNVISAYRARARSAVGGG